jgi:hypothetical protein
MTLFIATRTDGCAWLTEDSSLTDPTPAALAIIQQAAAAADVEAGPDSIPKIAPIADRKMLVGGAGDFFALALWISEIVHSDAEDILDVDRIAKAAWERVSAMLRPLKMNIVTLGWSAAAGRCCGFVYDIENEFISTRLGIGHALRPEPDWTAHGAEALRLWDGAAQGENVEAFHIATARAQHASWKAGYFKERMKLGGPLHCGTVTRDGVEVRQIDSLDEPAGRA